MVESLLLHLLIGIIVFGAVFAVIKLILPGIGLPAWAVQAALIVASCIFLVWLIYLLVPLAHGAPCLPAAGC